MRAEPPGTDGDEGDEDGADWDRYDPAELRAVLDRYEIGIVTSITRHRRGSRRAPKVRLESSRGAFLLKRRAPGTDDPGRVRLSQHVQRALAEAGLPVAAIVPTIDGAGALVRDGMTYELFSFLPGRRDDKSEACARASGAMLARFHGALDAGALPADASTVGSWHARRGVPRALRRACDAALASGADATEEELARWCRYLGRAYEDAAERSARLGVGALPPAVNHGDWHPGNLLFEDGRVTGVLDFDAVRTEPRVMDVANAALQAAMNRQSRTDPREWPGTLDHPRIRAVVEGYDSVGPALSDAERRAVPWLMAEALIMEAIVPIVREGRFARFDGASVLRMVERRVRWLRERREALEGYLERRSR